ncbi:MAG: hypothetical protein EXX96DRAFT_478609 [Benjaminiella poitrasii]|nr:MAG: hypothetical protein EXX96DRAFT_478609 [Benjaminiella poitrasii]
MDNLDIPYYKVPPSYSDFLKNHLIPNKPAIIGPALIDSWKARKEWIVPIDTPAPSTATTDLQPKFKPNYAYLRDHFGSAQGQVAKCDERHFTDQHRTVQTFAEFIKTWEADDGKPSLYYLKDFHLAKAFPDNHFYQVPYLFEDDWLNEYWLQERDDDDYRFVYLGGDSTFTPLHEDVYRSYSWSSNVCGIKKWTFFPPGQEDLYKDRYGNRVYDIREVDPTEFPQFAQARKTVVYQRDGETIFVPSGWYHQVENIGAAISINHNWTNATNLIMTYRSLKKDYDDCVRAIEDLRESMAEFTEECQKLLLVHSGWDWSTFLSILSCVVRHRASGAGPAHQPGWDWQREQIKLVLAQWVADEGEETLLQFFKSKDNDLYVKYLELKQRVLFS